MGDAEYWRDVEEARKQRKAWHKQNTTPRDKELLNKLALRFEVETDGAGGERYVIYIETDRGTRTIDWWVATGLWKVRKGRAEGYGIYRLARYFQLIPKKAEVAT